MQDDGSKEAMEQDIWGETKYLRDFINNTENYGDSGEAVEVKVAYGSDIRPVKKVRLENAKIQKGVLSSSEAFAFLESLCEFAVGFVIYFRNNNFLDQEIKSEQRFEVEERFRFYKICFPLPQREIHNYDTSNLLIPTENE